MTGPRVLHLLRHGEPVLAGRMLGHTDSPATTAGIAACIAAAAPLRPSTIIASDLARARVCAGAIAVPHGVAVRTDPRWRELDFGAWDGIAPAAIDPAALAGFWQDPEAAPPPDGECWSALVTRIAAALAEVPDGALVVTHAGAIRASLAVLCGFTVQQGWAIDLPYAALLSLRCWPGRPPSAQIIGLST